LRGFFSGAPSAAAFAFGFRFFLSVELLISFCSPSFDSSFFPETISDLNKIQDIS